jgi:hypothetical protein
MNKKNILKKTAALVLGSTLTLAATGCGFVVTDNQKDMAQTIAKVDITEKLSDSAVSSIIKELPSTISKRDLIAAFLSYGYNQLQSMGYEAIFTQLFDSLVQREIMVQYTVAHYFEKGATVEACQKFADDAIAALDKQIQATATAEVKENLEKENNVNHNGFKR